MEKKIDERQIAITAEQKLTSALRSSTNSFADHINRKSGNASIKEANAISRTKKSGYKKTNNDQYFLRSISIKMARHGFINHFGVNTLRAGGIRKREIPKSTTYNFKSHMMNQKPRPFINEAVRQSGVVDYVAEKIGESRAELLTNEIIIGLRRDFI